MAPASPRSLTVLPAVAGRGRRGPSEQQQQQQQQRPRHCHSHRRDPGPGPSPAHGSALDPVLPGSCPRPSAPAAARAATAATAAPAAAAAAPGSHRPGRSQQPAPRALPPARPRPAGSRLEKGARGAGTAERRARGDGFPKQDAGGGRLRGGDARLGAGRGGPKRGQGLYGIGATRAGGRMRRWGRREDGGGERGKPVGGRSGTDEDRVRRKGDAGQDGMEGHAVRGRYVGPRRECGARIRTRRRF